ncbi:hypothetical protein CRUP_032711, partial [Coryphaenoides rupestris]
CSAWEVPRDSVILGSSLGSGGFGQIAEASVTGWSHCSTKVAVKILRRCSNESSLMSEAKVLSVLGPHVNITNLLGVCSPPGSFFLITELCCHGDLLAFLHHHKNSLLADEVPHPDNRLQDLLSFSHQVAEGMSFLASNNCVHQDLAARNVLVCAGGLVKVGDWRLSQDLHKDDNYIVHGNRYYQLKQNFLNGENTAMTRSRAIRTDKQPGNQGDYTPDTMVDQSDAELLEAGSSHSYLITMETSGQVLAGSENRIPLAVLEAPDASVEEVTSEQTDAETLHTPT